MAYNDTFGVLSEFREKVGENGKEYVTTLSYDSQNRPIALSYGSFGGSTTTLDVLNRMTYSSVKLGNTAFKSEYHFVAGGYGSGSLTGLVTSITQTGGNCSYGYDDNGNIANAAVNGKWAGYTYDALGQLIRVNDRSDTRAGSTGSTWVYEYDRGGNILSKKLYPYADTSSEPLRTTRFTYGNANWKDQLTAVDGVAIAYDAIGNPLNDGTWTYTWQNGRQLAAMRKSGMEVSFRYNANGLRTHKIVNGVVTKYTLHGKNVVHMTKGSDELHFFYDAQNRPAIVVYNGTAYAYVKNLQGDVIAILDAEGNVVVSYAYDVWGTPIGKAGTLASTLGTVQPFRYRGYVYDEEAGMYYLVSRYYKPEWIRFISSDVIFDTGANLLKFNTYLYVANNPISSSDINGNWIIKDAVKWLAKNVAEPIVDACENLLDNVDYTFSFGFAGSISLGFWSFSGSIGWSCDSNGNYGWQITEGAALTTGDAGISGGIFFSATNAPDILKLEGEALAIGGSFGTGLEVSAELNIIPDYANNKTYYGTTYVFGLSAEASAAEFHIAGSTTQTIPGTRRNAFNDCRTILGWIEEW